MRNILVITFMLLACIARAADTVLVDDNGALAYPTKATFFNNNVRKFRQKFRLFIETAPSPASNYMSQGTVNHSNPFYYKDANNTVQRTNNSSGNTLTTFADYYKYYNLIWWTDCEIKVIDKWGNLLVFLTTVAPESTQVASLHENLHDRNARIFGWSALDYNDTGGCWGQKIELTDRSSSLGEMAGSSGAISAIWISPSIDSAETRSVPVYTGAGVYTMQTVVWGKYLRAAFENPENTVLAWRQNLSDGEYFNGAKLWRPVRIEYYGDFEEITE